MALLDHYAAGQVQKDIHISLYRQSIGLACGKGTSGAIAKPSCSASVNERLGSFDRVQPLEDRMQRFHHLGGIAAITLTA
jgi:hypothetical protein